MRLQSRLDSLVRESGDPKLINLVITQLGNGVPANARLYHVILDKKRKLSGELVRMYINPHKSHAETLQAQWKQAQRDMIQKRFEEMAKQRENLMDLFREWSEESEIAIVARLKDESPMVRWLAVQVVGTKRYHREGDLINLLEDPNLLVRQAAKQALVRLSRGNDFGPTGANPSAAQWKTARASWRSWLTMQDPPAQGQ